MSGINEKKVLSIAIPTYNRKEDLLNLLSTIEKNDYTLLSEIIISDNHSNYDIRKELVNHFSKKFLDYCRIIVNPLNIGGPGNIKNMFLLCKSKYMWLIGDDDEILPNALNVVLDDIKNDPECAFFRYSITIKDRDSGTHDVYEENRIMSSLEDFLCYYEEKQRHKGNLVFMSNNIFNMEKLAPYIHYAITYNTSITQLIPFLMGLDEKKIYIRYRNQKIVQFDGQSSGTAWSYIRVMGAISTINQVPFKSLDKKQFKRFVKVFNFINLRQFMFWCLVNKDKVIRIDMVTNIYRNFYRYSCSIKDFVIYVIGLIELKYGIRLIPRAFLNKKSF